LRKLEKLPKPAVLLANEDQWTVDYVAAHGTADAKRHEKWRHPEIKSALSVETGGKCAYCEAFVEDVAFPHVEHIIPKFARPDLAHRWPNLTTACPKCNVYKDDEYTEEVRIIDPYNDEIDDHLRFLGDLVLPELGSLQGELTVEKLRLNRFDLMRSRVDRLKTFKNLLERWHQATGWQKSFYADGIRIDAQSGEFSRTVTAYLTAYGFPVAG
jgi:uncharacterized protein (TIGR02646 family)